MTIECGYAPAALLVWENAHTPEIPLDRFQPVQFLGITRSTLVTATKPSLLDPEPFQWLLATG